MGKSCDQSLAWRRGLEKKDLAADEIRPHLLPKDGSSRAEAKGQVAGESEQAAETQTAKAQNALMTWVPRAECSKVAVV